MGVFEHSLGGGNLEEVLNCFLHVALNHFRTRSINCLPDHWLVGLFVIGGLDQVRGNLQSQVRFLQVLVVNHIADFALDLGRTRSHLALVAFGEGFETIQGVQMDLALLFLKQVKEGGQEALRGVDRDHGRVGSGMLAVSCDHGESFEGGLAS